MTLPGTCRNPGTSDQTHRTPKPVIANQRARWCGNPSSLQAARLARPGRGALGARAYDRPHGRCNAFALRGNGLPRRCAPRNDRFGGRVPLGGAAKQICSCPAGASPRPTGAWPGAGALGRGCRANLQLPGGGEPPPYGCMAGAGCVGTGVPGEFAIARRARCRFAAGGQPGGGRCRPRTAPPGTGGGRPPGPRCR